MNIAQAQAIKTTRDMVLHHAEILKMLEARVKEIEAKIAKPVLRLPVKDPK